MYGTGVAVWRAGNSGAPGEPLRYRAFPPGKGVTQGATFSSSLLVGILWCIIHLFKIYRPRPRKPRPPRNVRVGGEGVVVVVVVTTAIGDKCEQGGGGAGGEEQIDADARRAARGHR